MVGGKRDEGKGNGESASLWWEGRGMRVREMGRVQACGGREEALGKQMCNS